jgi:hypothetical protein
MQLQRRWSVSPCAGAGGADTRNRRLMEMTMSRIATIAAIVASTIAFAAPAHAGSDPHMPDPFNGNCPGGGGGNAFEGYCDGLHYPDGSYWHKINYGAATAFPWFMPGQTKPMQLGLSCVIDPDNGPIPQPAPPGGCGGAV